MIFDNFIFLNLQAFWLLLSIVVFLFVSAYVNTYENLFSKEMLNKIILGKSRKKLNFILLFIAFILLIITLGRPVLSNEPIKVKQNNLALMVAFDISRSMQCEDVFPNRLAFAKNKFDSLLKNLSNEKIGALAFSSRAFLIAPITNDYHTLKYLIKNINTKYISVNGSDIYEALQSTKVLLSQNKQKSLIIFTDGTDKIEFDKEIKFAKQNDIKVFIYAIATKKGGVIKTKDAVVKDENGNIVITKLNTSIKQLALQTSGAYLEYSSSKNDIKKFVNIIKKSFTNTKKEQKDVIISTNQELFYFPLALALLFIFIAINGFKREVK